MSRKNRHAGPVKCNAWLAGAIRSGPRSELLKNWKTLARVAPVRKGALHIIRHGP
jgi:hypothetical protein